MRMDVNFILKVAMIGIIVAVLSQILIKTGRDEYAMLTTLAGIVVVLMMLLPHFSTLLSSIKSVFGF